MNMAPTDMADTAPSPSRPDQDGIEHPPSNEEWAGHCARRIAELHPEFGADKALVVAQWLSLNGSIRALPPEMAADGFAVP